MTGSVHEAYPIANFGTQASWSADNIDAIGFPARAEPGATTEAKLELDKIGFYTEK